MLNIVVINCEGRYEEYEWPSKEVFVQEIESNGKNVPMFDNILTEVNAQDENLQLSLPRHLDRMYLYLSKK